MRERKDRSGGWGPVGRKMDGEDEEGYGTSIAESGKTSRRDRRASTSHEECAKRNLICVLSGRIW